MTKSTSQRDARGLIHSFELGTAIILALAIVAALTGCAGSASFSVRALRPAGTPTPQPVAAPPPTVVFLGDSITYNWRTFDPAAWAAHPEWNDQGVSGQNSLQLLMRFQADVVYQHPAEVHLLTGTNDVYPGWQLCGGSPVFDTCANIIQIVAEARAAGIRVVLATIPPWGAGALATAADPSPERFARIAQLNAWIVAYGAAQGIPVADYHAALVAANGENYVPAYTVDSVHPSLAGFEQMDPIVESAIEEAAR